MKKQPKISNPFTLRHRFYHKTGEPKDWSATATGQFTDIQTAQKSIRVLKANYTGHRMDIEFIYEGKLRDFNGNESLKYIECR